MKKFACKIGEETGIKRGLPQVREFIGKTGFNWSYTRQTDPVKQREWKENILDKAVREVEKGKCQSFLPACSPGLNIIERLWKFIKNEILLRSIFMIVRKNSMR
jgi:hypothetical protein